MARSLSATPNRPNLSTRQPINWLRHARWRACWPGGAPWEKHRTRIPEIGCPCRFEGAVSIFLAVRDPDLILRWDLRRGKGFDRPASHATNAGRAKIYGCPEGIIQGLQFSLVHPCKVWDCWEMYGTLYRDSNLSQQPVCGKIKLSGFVETLILA